MSWVSELEKLSGDREMSKHSHVKTQRSGSRETF